MKPYEEKIVMKLKWFVYRQSTLLEDRNALIAKNNEMFRDMVILRQKLEDFKYVLPGSYSSKQRRIGNRLSANSKIGRYLSDPEINDVSHLRQ